MSKKELIDYVNAQQEGVQLKFDEESGSTLVNTGSGWLPLVSSNNTLSSAGYTTAPHGSTLTGVTPSVWLDPSVHVTALAALNSLIQAVEAGAECRCAPTEVCPECHTLNEAVARAKHELEAATAPRYGPSTRYVKVNSGDTLSVGTSVAYSGTTGISSGTLKVGT